MRRFFTPRIWGTAGSTIPLSRSSRLSARRNCGVSWALAPEYVRSQGDCQSPIRRATARRAVRTRTKAADPTPRPPPRSRPVRPSATWARFRCPDPDGHGTGRRWTDVIRTIRAAVRRRRTPPGRWAAMPARPAPAGIRAADRVRPGDSAKALRAAKGLELPNRVSARRAARVGGAATAASAIQPGRQPARLSRKPVKLSTRRQIGRRGTYERASSWASDAFERGSDQLGNFRSR